MRSRFALPLAVITLAAVGGATYAYALLSGRAEPPSVSPEAPAGAGPIQLDAPAPEPWTIDVRS